MLSHAYYIIVDYCIGAPGYGKNVFDSVNAINKKRININGKFSTVQIPGFKEHENHMEMHTSTPKRK